MEGYKGIQHCKDFISMIFFSREKKWLKLTVLVFN